MANPYPNTYKQLKTRSKSGFILVSFCHIAALSQYVIIRGGARSATPCSCIISLVYRSFPKQTSLCNCILIEMF